MPVAPAALALAALLVGSTVAAAQTPALQVLPPHEYSRLPEDAQVLFLAGVLEGIAFTSYLRPDYTQWTDCVRKEPLETLLKEVNASVGIGAQEPIPWLVVRALAARDCPR